MIKLLILAAQIMPLALWVTSLPLHMVTMATAVVLAIVCDLKALE
jgi:hypothetical protein